MKKLKELYKEARDNRTVELRLLVLSVTLITAINELFIIELFGGIRLQSEYNLYLTVATIELLIFSLFLLHRVYRYSNCYITKTASTLIVINFLLLLACVLFPSNFLPKITIVRYILLSATILIILTNTIRWCLLQRS